MEINNGKVREKLQCVLLPHKYLRGYCDKSFDSFCSSRNFHKSPDTHWVRILPHENFTFLVKRNIGAEFFPTFIYKL